MEISNKSLALLLVAAIAVSLIGTIFSLDRLGKLGGSTGYVASTGSTNVTIQTLSSIRFTVNNLEFGSGWINQTAAFNCTMYFNSTTPGYINKSVGCVNFSTSSTVLPLIIENNGNADLTSVKLSTDVNASAFIGGGFNASASTPEFKYQVMNNETGSCAANLGPVNWTNVNASGVGVGTVICTDFNFGTNINSIAIGVWLGIPYDATGTNKVATFYLTAS